LRIATFSAIEDIFWELKTLSNTLKLALQNKLIKKKIAYHQNSSPTAINKVVD